MADETKVYGNRWKVVRELGKSGQGVVYEVEDAPKVDVSTEVAAIQKGLVTVNAIGPADEKFRATLQIINALKPLVAPNTNPKGALKELLPIDQAVNAETALTRMKTEIETLKVVQHPALVRVLDDHIEERWFVTELFRHGTLGDRIDLYEGHVLQALTAFGPLVDALSKLHERKTVHRDIKPVNVFIGDDGRLVLGDCGLAIKLDAADRITDTYENVGSWAWMPGWALGMRVDDVKPNFDVYSLGKLLWAMLAGKPRLRLWYSTLKKMTSERCFLTAAEFISSTTCSGVAWWNTNVSVRFLMRYRCFLPLTKS
ncbi:MAG TPA: protein kinase [Vicinamibacterales bacterium]|nr:protein kinase [Vicinamibacterales bacterium]